MSSEYADSDRNWDIIDAVVRIAHELSATPTQVALSWLADRPAIVAPITSTRTVEHLVENLGASGLHLDPSATSTLEQLSAPRPGGYPYGAFGRAQRSRNLAGRDSLVDLISAGSDTPTGTA